jgi:hypothetical protein
MHPVQLLRPLHLSMLHPLKTTTSTPHYATRLLRPERLSQRWLRLHPTSHPLLPRPNLSIHRPSNLSSKTQTSSPFSLFSLLLRLPPLQSSLVPADHLVRPSTTSSSSSSNKSGTASSRLGTTSLRASTSTRSLDEQEEGPARPRRVQADRLLRLGAFRGKVREE